MDVGPLLGGPEESMTQRSGPACKLCGKQTQYRFSNLLLGTIEAAYFKCESCDLLQSDHLDHVNSEDMSGLYAKGEIHDTGAAWRQICICTRLEQLTKLGVIRGMAKRPIRALDFGAGSGFCVSFMRHRLQWEAYGFDLFSDPTFAKNNIFNSWSDVQARAPFDVIIASEVFEHFRAPLTEIGKLSEVLSESNGSLFVTTGLFLPEIHDATWHYLAPQSGQHICFFGKRTMKEVARQLRAQICVNLAADYEWLFQRNGSNKPARVMQVKLACKVLSIGTKFGIVKKIE